jgi:glycosyltransferase involved in cell wall biosynthesis
MLVLLGRRGAMPRLALQLAQAAAARDDLDFTLVLACDNDLVEQFRFLGDRLLVVDAVDRGSVLRSARNVLLCTQPILARIACAQPDAVINLCPHVATPVLALLVRRLGIPYATVVHDASGHPGDRGGVLAPWFRMEARVADAAVTLSRYVACELVRKRVEAARIVPLFLPDLAYGPETGARRRATGKALRLLFFGRLLKYRGLDVLVDALERLAHQAVGVRATIAGAGSIARDTSERLAALGCDVVNRWIGETELARLLAEHDVVVASHLECSQSGAVAAAFGSCLPVVALPVGGLLEQVQDGRTGVLADGTDAAALARTIHRLSQDTQMYESISAHLEATRSQRSTGRFLDQLLAAHTLSNAASGVSGQAAAA